MSFDDDMRNRFANQTPRVSKVDAGAAAAANSAKRRTAVSRGLAAIALVAVVGLGALALTSGGTDLTNVATESPEQDGADERPVDDESQESESNDDPVTDEATSGAGEPVRPVDESNDDTPEDNASEGVDETDDPEETDEVDEPPVSTLGDQVVFRVTNVESNDVLNVRAGPGTTFDVVSAFAPDATGVVRTDSESSFVGTSEWIEVYGTVAGTSGWVNSAFLTPAGVIDARPCAFDSGDVSDVAIFENVEGSANSDARIVSVLGTYRYGSCIRTVIQGLDGFSSSNDPADPVTVLPNDMGIGLMDGQVGIVFGPSIIGSDLAQARYVEPGLSDPGGVRSSTFLFSPPVEGPPGQEFFFSGIVFGPSAELSVAFDNDLGRIVIDVPDMGEANTNVGPLLDEDGIVLVEVVVDGRSVELSGLARPFESNLLVEVLLGDTPLDVNWDGAIRPGPTSANGVMTTDWSSGWGVYEFTIEVDEGVDLSDVIVRFDPDGGATENPDLVAVSIGDFLG